MQPRHQRTVGDAKRRSSGGVRESLDIDELHHGAQLRREAAQGLRRTAARSMAIARRAGQDAEFVPPLPNGVHVNPNPSSQRLVGHLPEIFGDKRDRSVDPIASTMARPNLGQL